MRTNETRAHKSTRKAARLAYRIERTLRRIAPWDFSDIEEYQPDYLRTWTNDILTGNTEYMIRSMEQGEDTKYLAEQLRTF